MAKRARDEITAITSSKKAKPEEETNSVDEADDMSEADDGMEEEEDEAEKEEASKPVQQGKLTKKAKKALSAQEVQVARETAELFKSNIFKLQIDELVKEVKLKDSHIAKIEKVLHRLHDLIQQIPSIENLSLSQVEHHFNNKKIVVPFPDPKPTKVNYTFSFLPPKDISLVGSFGLKTGINSPDGMSVDIALTMPSELLQPKDYLNYRALYKRAFYISYLAEHLIILSKKNNLPIKVSYEFVNDDILCPALKIESINTNNENDLIFYKTKFTINILVGFPFGFFDSKKLLPDKNCIRVQVPEKQNGNSEAPALPPTPLYNSSILTSTAYDYYLKYLYTNKKSADSFRDACVLGRLWLKQRGLGSSINAGGFGHFEFSILMSALLHGGGLNSNKILLHGFSSYQLFKGTIKYLATQDLSSGYLSFSSAIGESSSKYVEEGFNVPTIFDKNTKINVLWKMTKSSYESLKKQAVQTLDLLNEVVKDRFDAILLQKSNVDYLKFDVVFKLTVPEDLIDSFGPLEKISFITFDNYVKNKLYKILSNALGERVHTISIKNESVVNTCSIHKRKPARSDSTYVIGLSLNSDECEKLVTKGPYNEDATEGLKFRSFWGSKSSLRRFKDGTIQHCVVWDSSSTEPVILSIIYYILELHFHAEIKSHISSNVTLFNEQLPIPLLPAATKQSIISLVPFQSLKASYDALVKVITNFESPLNIKTVLPTSPSLRYTSLLQPVPFATSSPDFWNELVLQFETSTRWPDELIALERTKTAFLLKILDSLNKDTAYKAFITKDNSIPYNDDISLLNILTPEGYGFKIRVLTERDETLYLRAVNNDEKQKPLLQDIYLKFNQKYIASIKHTRAVTSLAQHFQFYSPTVRLFKKWLDSQLLLEHFNDEIIELIALKPFVDPAPYTTPSSVENGFLQILSFLSNWNWIDDSLVLDLSVNDEPTSTDKLSDKLSIQAVQVIQSNFDKVRKADPSGIKTQMFIGSKYDPSGILWSSGIALPIASRLTALTRVAMNLINGDGISKDSINLLFTPALADYDFIIHVKTASLTASSGILPSNTFKNLINNEKAFPEDLNSRYDYVQQFYRELDAKFGNVILFSGSKYTGLNEKGESAITGLFMPNILGKKKFKVNLGYNVKPSEENEEVSLNKRAIFTQISILGGDLIESIEIRK